MTDLKAEELEQVRDLAKSLARLMQGMDDPEDVLGEELAEAYIRFAVGHMEAGMDAFQLEKLLEGELQQDFDKGLLDVDEREFAKLLGSLIEFILKRAEQRVSESQEAEPAPD